MATKKKTTDGGGLSVLDTLMGTATVKSTTKSSSKRVEQVKTTEFSEAIEQMATYKTIEEQAKAKKDEARGIVLENVKPLFAKAPNIESFIVTDGGKASVMILPKNSATKIKDDESAENVNKFFNKHLGICMVQKDVEVSFNSELLKKHYAVIKKAIDELPIANDEKMQLLNAEASFSYTESIPETIKKLPTEDLRLQALAITNMTFDVKTPKVNGLALPVIEDLMEKK